MKRIFNVCMIFLTFFILLTSFVEAGGFDDLGNSARVAAMGGTSLGIGKTPYSVFYNPAAIYSIDKPIISTSYSNLFPGIEDDNINYFSLSGTLPVDIIGKFGIGGTFLTTELYQENSLLVSYGREIYNNFAIGGTFKFLRWSADPAPGEAALSYTGFTFDIGAFYTFQNVIKGSDISFGASAQNITEPSIASNGNSEAKLPMKIGVGLAYYSSVYEYLFAFDFYKEEEQMSIKAGTEFSVFNHALLTYNTNLLLRFGYDRIIQSDFAEQSALHGGFGLNVEQIGIDYAYSFPFELKNVGGMHKFTLTYKF